MLVPKMSVPLPPDMKDVVVKDGPDKYEALYEELDKNGNCLILHRIKTDSFLSFATHLMSVLLSPEMRLIHIRLGRRKALLRWSKNEDQPDGPI